MASGNERRFDGRAEVYARYRERYDPEIVLPLLRKGCGLTPEWVIADLGAGTGMLSDVFLANGNRVIAIEPNAEMRDQCEREHQGESKLEIVDATAEATGLPDASVEMVAAGRALHWFKLDDAVREFRRILKPGGWLVIVASGRDEAGTPANVALRELLESFMSPELNASRMKSVYEQAHTLFAEGEWFHEEVFGEMLLSWEALRGLAMSGSMSPVGDPVKLEAFDAGLGKIFDEFQQDGAVRLQTRYWIEGGRLAPASDKQV